MLARCFSHIFSIDCPRQISMLLISLFPLNFRVVNESGEQHPPIRSHGSRTRVATKKTKGLPISNSHTRVAKKKNEGFPDVQFSLQCGHQENQQLSDVQTPTPEWPPKERGVFRCPIPTPVWPPRKSAALRSTTLRLHQGGHQEKERPSDLQILHHGGHQ